jgi:phage-related holin
MRTAQHAKHSLILDILHVRNNFEALLNLFLSAVGAFFGYFHLMIVTESNIFITVGIVVGIDWVAGMANALKHKTFESNKAKKVVFYLIAYWFIGVGCIVLANTFKSAFWVKEAIMFPLLFSQLISAIKNFNLSGIIPSETLKELLKNIDKHKNQVS